MTLNRWDPLRDLLNFQERMNRLMDAAFDENVSRPLGRPRSWKPAVDILETQETYIFRMDLPGVGKDNINIEIEGTRLTVSGVRELESEPRMAAYHSIERQTGFFEQNYRLPGAVDQDKCEAKYTDGVLTIILPKTEFPREHMVKVVCST